MILAYLKMAARAQRARDLALRDCELARLELDAAVHEAAAVYREHPVPFLAGAAGVGFVLAQVRVGSGLVKAGMRIATGPAWNLVRQFVQHID